MLCFLAASVAAMAQISVSVQTTRSTFLLYERVDLLVNVTNMSDSEISLSNTEGSPWLSFMVSKRNHLPVKQERESTFNSLTLKVGEMKTLRVNLTPLFSFREEGQYKAAAVIDLPGAGQVVSESIPFQVVNGNKIWSQQRPVEGEQYTYSLIRFSPEPDRTSLYLRVENPIENTVYTNLSLGEVVSSVEPTVFFDPQGNIQILQPFALGTYLYTRADAKGKVVHQAVFKTFQTIPPRLTKLEDGNVIVVGGLEENPDNQRERLSTGQQVQNTAAAPLIQQPHTDAPPVPADAPVKTVTPPTNPVGSMQ